VKAGTTDRFPG